jgi:hypothetical protein
MKSLFVNVQITKPSFLLYDKKTENPLRSKINVFELQASELQNQIGKGLSKRSAKGVQGKVPLQESES